MHFATPGTQYKTYADAIYTSQHPLGPFVPAKEEPFSHKPTGFAGGSGHGSTFADLDGNYWHIATSTISVRDRFERRLSMFPVFFAPDGTMFADTYFGDYPTRLPARGESPVRAEAALGTRWSVRRTMVCWHLGCILPECQQ